MSYQVINPFIQFVDPINGQPLSAGSVYFGRMDSDPKNQPANRINVYAVQDNGSEVLLSQPITLNGAGQPQYSGSVKQIKVELYAGEASYAIQVFNKNGSQKGYSARCSALIDSVSLGAVGSAVLVGGVEAGELAITFAQTVNVRNFGALGNGVADDTAAIQSAIDSLGANGGVVIVPAGDYRIDVDVNPTGDDFGGIKVKSNIHLVIQKGAKLRAFASDKTFTCVVQAYKVSNVTISGGGTIIGERYIHIGTTGEHGMGVAVFGSVGVTIEDLIIQDCWGDAVYVGYANVGGVYTPSSQVFVRNNTLKSSRRQGVSVVYTDVFEVSGNTILDIQGAPPEAAIDLEPDTPARQNSNGIVSNNKSFNTGQGITMYVSNENMVINDNICLSRGVAFRSVDNSLNTRVDGNTFISTAYGTESAVWIDAGVFTDLSSLSITNNNIVNGGTNGCIQVSANASRCEIKNNRISVTRAELVAMVIIGNANVIDNFVTLSALALSGANKNVVFAQDGTFSGNRFTNLTAQTPQYQYLGSSKIAPPDTREGNWTPTLVTTGTGFTSVTYGTQTAAKYVKVGTTVFVQGHLRTTAITVGAASGNVRIGGLPFPAETTGGGLSDWANFTVGFADSWVTANPTSLLLGAGDSSARLITSGASGASSELTVANVNSGAGNVVYFSGFYITSDKT